MFCEIGLLDEKKDFHHYIFLGKHDKTTDMRMRRLTFGVTSLLYLATQVLHQIANDHQTKFPSAAKILRESFYVDDYLTGVSTIVEATAMRVEFNLLSEKGCMKLRKWHSNSYNVLQTIPKGLREMDPTLTIRSPDEPTRP